MHSIAEALINTLNELKAVTSPHSASSSTQSLQEYCSELRSRLPSPVAGKRVKYVDSVLRDLEGEESEWTLRPEPAWLHSPFMTIANILCTYFVQHDLDCSDVD